MPHYSDGQLAQIGDVVKGRDGGGEIIGVVCTITPGSESCNMQVRGVARIFGEGASRGVLAALDAYMACVTCKDFLKIALVLFALSVCLAAGVAAAQDGAAPKIGPLTAIDAGQVIPVTMPEPIAVQHCEQCQPVAAAAEEVGFGRRRFRRLRAVGRFVFQPVRCFRGCH